MIGCSVAAYLDRKKSTEGLKMSYLLLCLLVFAECWSLNAMEQGRKSQSSVKITNRDIDRAIAFGVRAINSLHLLEGNILDAHIALERSGAKANDLAREISRNALIMEKATIYLITRFCLKTRSSPKKCLQMIGDFNAKKTREARLHDECAKLTQKCSHAQTSSKYRQLAGACNHEEAPTLGQALTTFKRLLPAAYGDQIHSMRRSVTKKLQLPSARLVTEAIIHPERANTPGGNFSLLFALWGEFIEHDLVQFAPQEMIHSDSSISCCSTDGNKLAPRHRHPFCSAIEFPHNETSISRGRDVRCFNYVRSMGGLRTDCSFGSSDQLNQATHYLDASQIYGNNADESKLLRVGTMGQLCSIEKHPLKNEETSTAVTVLHALFLREHNRIAHKLAELNPDWNDDELFEETRRVVIAEIQHITYTEWLPLLLPEAEMQQITTGEYQDSVDPAVSSSFATAAIRFTQSLIPDEIQLLREDRVLNSSLKFSDSFSNMQALDKTDLSFLLRGLTTQESRPADLIYAKQFIDLPAIFGADVLSTNIQRGRDHGLPGYNAYRKFCGRNAAEVFDDLLDAIAPETVERLSRVYNHPSDIDLIIGGLSETRQATDSVGNTLKCILADQFARTRAGDRYFYSFANSAQFTPAQIHEIRQVTLSKTICENADVLTMQPNAFLPISSSNKLTSCKDLPGIDLSAWKV